MKSTIHGVRSFDRSPTTLFKTFLVDWCDFIQQNRFNLTEKRSSATRRSDPRRRTRGQAAGRSSSP